MSADTDKLIDIRERRAMNTTPRAADVEFLLAALEAAEARLREASLPSSEDVQTIFRLAEMTERAEAAETQRDEALGARAGEVSAVQKVLEERRRAEAAETQLAQAKSERDLYDGRCCAAETQRDTLARALDLIANGTAYVMPPWTPSAHARAALAEVTPPEGQG